MKPGLSLLSFFHLSNSIYHAQESVIGSNNSGYAAKKSDKMEQFEPVLSSLGARSEEVPRPKGWAAAF